MLCGNERYNFNVIINEQYNKEKIKNILSIECLFIKKSFYDRKTIFQFERKYQ
jgi:hypothetical protein